ncbi:MAG: IPT/TIG domain-containing protein [Chloroflexota bacterium]
MHIKRIGAHVVAGLLLFMLILPQVALAGGPEISDVDVEGISFASATITWTTNTSSDSTVNYGIDRSEYASWNSTHEDNAVTHHSILLQGLTPDQIYYFEVQSTDGSGTATDNNGGEYYSFNTLAWYSISLGPIAGTCGKEITVTATVATPGTYRICWDSLTNAKATFTANTAGVHYPKFYIPEATKGNHKVYLVDSTGAQKAEANFEITPSVQIDADEGPVGTAVTISGCGFAASQDIQIEFKDTVISTTQTTSSGTWPSISYTIPDTPGGDYNFEVEVDEAVWASRGFEVTPEITVSSSSGIVGHTIEVKGTGFQSNEKDIEVTFDGEAGTTNTPIVANPNGSWTATIVIPLVPRGPQTVDASGDKTSASSVPDIEDFVVGAGIILVEPLGSYHVGDPVTVAGGGFAEYETGITVTFAGQPIASGIKAKEDGTWEYTFNLPAGAYGPGDVEAFGDVTKPAVSTSLSIQARILEISPSSGAPGDLVSLTGDGFGSSEQLTVAISGIAAPDSMRTQPNGNVAVSFHVPAQSPEGEQTLEVSDGSGASALTGFTVTTKTLSITPLPISPRDSTLRSGVVTFRWQAVPSGSDSTYTYTLELSRNAGGGSFWSLENISASNYTWSEDDPLEKGTYYWRVKLVDDYGNESAWSESVEFRVSPIPIWVWVIVGVVVLIVLMYVAYRETKFKVTE